MVLLSTCSMSSDGNRWIQRACTYLLAVVKVGFPPCAVHPHTSFVSTHEQCQRQHKHLAAVQCTYSSCTASAEAVVAFWQALGFQVAYDIVREGVTATCHSNGFAINARWCQVLVPAPLAALMHCITNACTCYTVPSLL